MYIVHVCGRPALARAYSNMFENIEEKKVNIIFLYKFALIVKAMKKKERKVKWQKYFKKGYVSGKFSPNKTNFPYYK